MVAITKKRLAQYSSALGTLVVAGQAVAAEQAITPQNFVFTDGGGGFFSLSGSLDVNGDSVIDYYVFGFYYNGSGYISLSDSFNGGVLPYNQIVAQYDGYGNNATALAGGSTVDGSLSFVNASITTYVFKENDPNDFLDFLQSRGFIGLNFDIPGNSPHFACMEILVEDTNADGAPDLQVLGGVFEDVTATPVVCPVAAILPEAVPISGVTAPLSVGLLGALLYNGRRRRNKTQA